jgi:23S rRNA pseudouridine1911/1915/1917 synthase
LNSQDIETGYYGQGINLVVDEEGVGRRLDAFLGERFRDYSRSRLASFVRSGQILVNGGKAKPSYRLRPGDVVAGELAPTEEAFPVAEDIPLSIYYADYHVVVAEKPAGMLTHPAGYVRTGTLVNALLYRVGTLSTVGGPHRPGIVHRLDKGTSGVLVVARSELGHTSLVKQFSNRTTARTYVALAEGDLPLDEGIVDAPIGRSSRDPKIFAVSPLAAKEALTTFKVLARYGGRATLLRLRLHTGRTHQIRVHLAYLGHPVLGDATYGSNTELIDRPALHAHTLAFDHPATGVRMKFLSPLPADILRTQEQLAAGITV